MFVGRDAPFTLLQGPVKRVFLSLLPSSNQKQGPPGRSQRAESSSGNQGRLAKPFGLGGLVTLQLSARLALRASLRAQLELHRSAGRRGPGEVSEVLPLAPGFPLSVLTVS